MANESLDPKKSTADDHEESYFHMWPASDEKFIGYVAHISTKLDQVAHTSEITEISAKLDQLAQKEKSIEGLVSHFRETIKSLHEDYRIKLHDRDNRARLLEISVNQLQDELSHQSQIIINAQSEIIRLERNAYLYRVKKLIKRLGSYVSSLLPVRISRFFRRAFRRLLG